jgi:hypothetical protein
MAGGGGSTKPVPEGRQTCEEQQELHVFARAKKTSDLAAILSFDIGSVTWRAVSDMRVLRTGGGRRILEQGRRGKQRT